VVPQFKKQDWRRRKMFCFMPTKCMELLVVWSGDFAMDRVHWADGQITVYKREQPLAERKEVLV